MALVVDKGLGRRCARAVQAARILVISHRLAIGGTLDVVCTVVVYFTEWVGRLPPMACSRGQPNWPIVPAAVVECSVENNATCPTEETSVRRGSRVVRCHEISARGVRPRDSLQQHLPPAVHRADGREPMDHKCCSHGGNQMCCGCLWLI